MMTYAKILIITILMLLGILVIIQNMDTFAAVAVVRLNLYAWEGATSPCPIYLIIILAFLGGVVLTCILGFYERILIHREMRLSRHKVAELQKEINAIRAYGQASGAGEHKSGN
jgi:uncharacterized integral membrane protein